MKFLDTKKKIENIESISKYLKSRVIAQNEACECLEDVCIVYSSRIQELNRPLANILLVGPTGTGKTFIVETFAEALLGNSKAIVKINCSEFQHSHEIAKLIGSPPGYLGHKETNPVLTQAALDFNKTNNWPIGIVLFDEIEKASDAVWDILLGIMDKGELTLGDNRKVNFQDCFIFMTSNLGSKEIEAKLEDKELGFSPPKKNPLDLTKISSRAIASKFRPEFVNRIDFVIPFNALTKDDVEKILFLELNKITTRVYNKTSKEFSLKLSTSAKSRIIELGYNTKQGARQLKRVLEQNITANLAILLASDQILPLDEILVGYSQNQFTFCSLKQSKPKAKTAKV